jgi:NADH-quinone oxidoreductase subunit J
MTFLTAIFYYMATASIASALLAVTRRNPLHSLLWVLALFGHVAGIFLLLEAEFLAAVQVVVYAGAILIFYLFVMMLLDLSDEHTRPRFGNHWPFAAGAGLLFVAVAFIAQMGRSTLVEISGTSSGEGLQQGGLEEIGMALFGPFALPFEMTSLVLLAAIVGAVVLARRRMPHP